MYLPQTLVFKSVAPNGSEPTWQTIMLYSDIVPLIYVNKTICILICLSTRFKSIILWPGMNRLLLRLSQNTSYGWGACAILSFKTFLSFLSSTDCYDYITSNWRLAGGLLFQPLSDAYVRSFLYLLYTLIKLYYTKALRDQALSMAPDWILLLRRPRIPASYCSATTF